MTEKRYCHAAVTINDHQMLVFGGTRIFPFPKSVGTVEEFDIRTNKWTKSQPKMPCPRADLVAVTTEEGDVHVIGGRDAYCFRMRADKLSLADNVWTDDRCDLPFPRASHAAARVMDKIVVVGGVFGQNAFLYPSTTPIWLDLTTGIWTPLPKKPSSAVRIKCAAVGIGETVYVIGGQNRLSKDLASMEAFNIRTKQWTELPDMLEPRSGHAAVAVGQRIIVVGGVGMNTGEMYDIATSQWSPLPRMRVPRWGAALAAPGGNKVIITGGSRGPNNFEISAEVEQLMLFPPQHAGQTDKEEGTFSKFFQELMETDTQSIERRLIDLVPFIRDVHQMKIYYTVVAAYLRGGLIQEPFAADCIKNGLKTSGETCIFNPSDNATFNLILDKAQDDKYITKHERYTFGSEAIIALTRNSEYIQEIVKAIHVNTADIKGLEANLGAVTNSVKSIMKGLKQKQKTKAILGFTSTVLNLVSMGVGGSLLTCLDSIVDFGDISHLTAVITVAEDSELLQYVQLGIAIAKDPNRTLEEAIENGDDHFLVILSASAILVQDFQVVQETYQSGAQAQAPAQQAQSSMFVNAMLSEEDEKNLPLHAAVKYSDEALLTKAIQDQASINTVDSQGRSAMDMAALTGQIGLMALIEQNGGQFMLYSQARGQALANKRSQFVDDYREQIRDSL
jgi:hypothetical protein